MKASNKTIIEIKDLQNVLGGHTIHKNLNLQIQKGEIIAIIGGSGCGKTTLLRAMLKLLEPKTGSIKIFDQEIVGCTEAQIAEIQKRWGVLFQSGALFSSLTLLENVLYPLNEFAKLPSAEGEEIALLKILLVGLEAEAAAKYPAELSGGMQKRAALARAIALDPELLFLDEPTTGLDPSSAGELDKLIVKLRDSLGLTIIMVTHDLDTLWTVPDRVIFLGEGKVLADAPMQELIKVEHGLIREYFSGPRGAVRRKIKKEVDNNGH